MGEIVDGTAEVGEVDGSNDGKVVEGLTVGDVGDSVGNDVGTMGYSQLQANE